MHEFDELTSLRFSRYPFHVVLRSPYALLFTVFMVALGLQIALWPAKKLDATLSEAHLVSTEAQSHTAETHDHGDGAHAHGDESTDSATQTDDGTVAHRHSPAEPVHEHRCVSIEAASFGFDHFQTGRICTPQVPYASYKANLPQDTQHTLANDYLSSIFRPPIA